MQLHQKVIDVAYMARDFLSVVRGTGYFHQPDLLGRYFVDGKSYFIDFRCKTGWSGTFQDGVPVLFFPSLSRTVFFPGMILQYGLGCGDRYLETGDPFWLRGVGSVADWMFSHCAADGSFDNLSREMNSSQAIGYYSNNSAMTQGLAISFLTRVLQHQLATPRPDVETMLRRMHNSMMLPLDQGGGALYKGPDLFLCEYCRTDEQVVLNGWIFAVFGLFDYCALTGDSDAKRGLATTLDTLSRSIDGFIIPEDDWSRYDNRGRIASPVYQITHINQADALYRLTGDKTFEKAFNRFTQGNSVRNKIKYTMKKIVEKVKDPYRHASTR